MYSRPSESQTWLPRPRTSTARASGGNAVWWWRTPPAKQRSTVARSVRVSQWRGSAGGMGLARVERQEPPGRLHEHSVDLLFPEALASHPRDDVLQDVRVAVAAIADQA